MSANSNLKELLNQKKKLEAEAEQAKAERMKAYTQSSTPEESKGRATSKAEQNDQPAKVRREVQRVPLSHEEEEKKNEQRFKNEEQEAIRKIQQRKKITRTDETSVTFSEVQTFKVKETSTIVQSLINLHTPKIQFQKFLQSTGDRSKFFREVQGFFPQKRRGQLRYHDVKLNEDFELYVDAANYLKEVDGFINQITGFSTSDSLDIKFCNDNIASQVNDFLIRFQSNFYQNLSKQERADCDRIVESAMKAMKMKVEGCKTHSALELQKVELSFRGTYALSIQNNKKVMKKYPNVQFGLMHDKCQRQYKLKVFECDLEQIRFDLHKHMRSGNFIMSDDADSLRFICQNLMVCYNCKSKIPVKKPSGMVIV